MRVGRNRTIRSHPSWASLRSSELEEDLRALRIPPATNVTYLFGRFPDGTDRLDAVAWRSVRCKCGTLTPGFSETGLDLAHCPVAQMHLDDPPTLRTTLCESCSKKLKPEWKSSLITQNITPKARRAAMQELVQTWTKLSPQELQQFHQGVHFAKLAARVELSVMWLTVVAICVWVFLYSLRNSGGVSGGSISSALVVTLFGGALLSAIALIPMGFIADLMARPLEKAAERRGTRLECDRPLLFRYKIRQINSLPPGEMEEQRSTAMRNAQKL